MEQMQKNILRLIQAALTGTGQTLDPDFSLDPHLDLIQKHQVDGLIYQGALLCGIPKGDPCMKRLFSRYYQHIVRSQRQMSILSQMFERFETQGIDYLPLKGTILKPLYPDPGMRPMGDADVLIRMEQYETIRQIMVDMGFEADHEWNHEIVWSHKDLYLEHHSRLVNNWPPNYFGAGWQRAVLEQGHRYGFSPEDTYIFLFAHYGKHYRAGGIGLRQLTDLWVWQQAHPAMDMDYIRQEMHAMNLQDFFGNTMRLLSNWFSQGPEDSCTKHMTDFIFSSGSWGDPETVIAARYAISVRNGAIKKSRLSIILHELFPSLSFMQDRHPTLKKYPILLPVFWLIRIVSTLLFKQKSVVSRFHRTSQQTVENIQNFEEALEFVGLDPKED